MGAMRLLKERDVKVNNYSTIATDNMASKSMASRIGMSRATKHIHLRLLYMQDLVAHGILRLKKVDAITPYEVTSGRTIAVSL